MIAGLLIAFAIASSPVPIARTDAGLVEGTQGGGLEVYKGIAYAAPPLGSLRWREPEPVAPWSGVRMAVRFAPACIQMGVSMPGETPPVSSEDCLSKHLGAGKAQRQSFTGDGLGPRRRVCLRFGIHASLLGRPTGTKGHHCRNFWL